jgi:hypothetical protein
VTAETDVSEALAHPTWAPEIPWLQPYPDHLLELPCVSCRWIKTEWASPVRSGIDRFRRGTRPISTLLPGVRLCNGRVRTPAMAESGRLRDRKPKTTPSGGCGGPWHVHTQGSQKT